MTEQELLDRIEKKEAQIAKINKRIEKWEAAKTEAGFIKAEAPYYSRDPKSVKTMDDLIQARAAFDPNDPAEFMQNRFEGHIQECDREIKYAKYDLADAEKTLEKYKAQLGDKKEKAAVEKIPAIVDFLETWKQQVIEFVNTKGLQSVEDYFEADSKYGHAWNNRAPKEELEQLKQERAIARDNMDQLTYSVYSRGKIDQEQLNKILDKDVEAKYFNLVARIKEKAGDIVDASNLSVSHKGDLNGKVIGTIGNVWVETIPAAGYNIQRFHYRTLVKPIK